MPTYLAQSTFFLVHTLETNIVFDIQHPEAEESNRVVHFMLVYI